MLPQVIDWVLAFEFRDERWLAGAPDDLLDVTLIDVYHSPDEEIASFYTTLGLLASRRHLAANGVLAVCSYAKSSPFADALREVFEPVIHANRLIDQQQTDWLFFAHG